MAFGRRKEILNTLKSELKNIDGDVSPYDSSYTFVSNLYSNIIRGFKFIDEINEFPSVYIHGGEELRIYHSNGLVDAELPVVARCYVKSETPQSDLDKISQDIEHMLENIPNEETLGIMDISIDVISTDEGLMDPYGIGEIFFNVFYELEK